MRWIALLAGGLLSACAAASAADAPLAPTPYTPGPGTNLVLEGPIEAAPGYHLVVGDLVLGAGAVVPAHIHSGEEFLYVIAGTATIKRSGEADVVLGPGDSLRVAPGVVHSGLAGPDGLRGVASWVVKDGQPLRSPPPE